MFGVAARSRHSPKLSVCCLSTSPLKRTAAILGQFRGVADEIVCAVDARVPEAELVELDGLVDVLRRCEFDPHTGIERHLAWLHSLCSGHWILRMDSDEAPSSELLEELPRLVQATDVYQYAIPCHWVFPDAEHVLDEYPWSSDWHLRLVRNDPIVLRFPGVPHSNIVEAEPLRYITAPFYHLTCVVQSQEEREAKARKYERLSPEKETMVGWSVNNHYLPERFQREPSSSVPPEDGRLITEVLTAGQGSFQVRPGWRARWRRPPHAEMIPLQESDQLWQDRKLSASAYHATLLSVPSIVTLRPGESRRIVVEVRNDGDTTWPFGHQHPEIRLSYHWGSPDGVGEVVDGIRSTFTADVYPGETALQPMTIIAPTEPGRNVLVVALVHEGVCWFAEGPGVVVSVEASS
jgi:hypothetical protein